MLLRPHIVKGIVRRPVDENRETARVHAFGRVRVDVVEQMAYEQKCLTHTYSATSKCHFVVVQMNGQ